jgi:adenine-specific DNA methylase
MPSFIETQFPIARLSAEAYKERKAGASQTLTGLGKWWGRKPLILVRASIIGMLMPASNDPKKDREIFLKILTMDDDGAWLRQKGDIPVVSWIEAAPQDIKEKYFTARGFQRGLTDEQKQEALDLIWESLKESQRVELDNQRRRPVTDRSEFDSMPYAERISHCERPENVSGPSESAWREINAHLNTTASNIQELVNQLGQREFGHTPRVGDSFCGGGSIPFEAARIGCEAFGSDLNPVAGLLTWASLNILGGGKEVQDEVRQAQAEVFTAADKQITEWGIEHNERGERGEAYLYCVEVKPEGCDYYIPLAPSWVISEKYRIVCTWHRDGSNRLKAEVLEVSAAELRDYKNKKGATVLDGRVIDPLDPERSWSVESLRGTQELRRWTNEDVVPRADDVFQERLYCIRWSKTVTDAKGKEKLVRRYAAPDSADLEREAKVLCLLEERFDDWQREGFIPSKAIVSGYNTDQPIRERGWTHWHHLFTPRQLLMHGQLERLFANCGKEVLATGLCLIGKICDHNSRLCGWNPHPSKGPGSSNHVFTNQALNTASMYAGRSLKDCQFNIINTLVGVKHRHQVKGTIGIIDARDLSENCDIWITDPPYADAVNYHELGDFFLAWYDKQLTKAFPEWVADSRAELAVKGDGADFRRSMVDVYKNLANNMPDNGLQMVQFTHQNPAVWADLGMILWAAGLKATAAWTICTETEAAGLKKGNYVQGTVCLVLRKRITPEPGFLDEVYPLVEDEVRRQVAAMQSLDQDAEPNFNDADYSLAAYAAALKVLTQYATLDGKDVEHEVFAVRGRNEKSDFETVIERAIAIACDTLVPKGLEDIWSDLSLVERYYLRALDIESRGERRKGMYEELARGFGVKDLRPLLKSDTANGTRMQTASGMGKRNLDAPTSEDDEASTGSHPFGCTPLRHLLFAIHETGSADNDPEPGRRYLRDTYGPTYWTHRESFVALLEWITALGNTADLAEWQTDSDAARILTGRLRNDHD